MRLPSLTLVVALGLLVATARTHTQTGLQDALRSGDLTAIQAAVVDRPALVSAKDDNGRTPLHVASAAGRDAVVAFLLSCQAEVDAADNSGITALHLVARDSGRVEVARLLLGAGADVDARDRAGDTALSLAASRGFRPLVGLLLERGAALPTDPGRRERMLHEAASYGLDRLFTRLLDANPALPVAAPGTSSLLHEAAASGSVRIVARLVKARLDVNQADADGWTPLHTAVFMNRYDVTSLLLNKGADPNRRNGLGQSPWNVAVEHDRLPMADLLALRGADRGMPRFPALAGGYLGQKPPGRVPEPFAPDIVGGHFELRGVVAFSPDLREAYWTEWLPATPRRKAGPRTMVSRRSGDRWTYPLVATAGGKALEEVVLVSADGRRLYEVARRALPGWKGAPRDHLWVAERAGDGWSEPRPVDSVVNTLPQHGRFAVDGDGGIYFSSTWHGTRGIFVARPVPGGFAEPVPLAASVNATGTESAPFVARDGSYLVFSRNGDLWVSFRGERGQWTKSVPLPAAINTPDVEACPAISPDGRFLFFLRGGLYWVDASFIEELRARAKQ